MSKVQEIRAKYDQNTISIYQAYNKKIADVAVKNQKFVAPFSFNRMTWIKPSFLWMMERSQWGQKSNQDQILEIKIKRSFFDKILKEGILTHPDQNIYKSGMEWNEKFDQAKIHIQWDPERTLKGGKLQIRTIQIGISRFLIDEYNSEGIVEIQNITPLVHKILKLKKLGKYKDAKKHLPVEKLYPISESIQNTIGIY